MLSLKNHLLVHVRYTAEQPQVLKIGRKTILHVRHKRNSNHEGQCFCEGISCGMEKIESDLNALISSLQVEHPSIVDGTPS
jgi:hypothetical protein